MGCAVPPASIISSAVSRQLSIFLLVMTTFAPWSANVFAIDLPIPRLPPVTIATLLVKSNNSPDEVVMLKLPLQLFVSLLFRAHFRTLN